MLYRHFHFAYTQELRIGYRKGPGRAGGKLTRSILLNSSTIPKGRRVEVEVEERECSGGENEGESVTTAMNGVESVARVKSLVRTFDDLLGLLCALS
jgi:hypothetical protein